MMFAADQIGMRYRQYVTDYRLLVEGQLKTADAFDFDHVSAISDPARESHDLGAAIAWFDDQPPANRSVRLVLALPEAMANHGCTRRTKR